MSFWAYMLHCADRTFYVGHTDELEKRVAQHGRGLIPGYTSERLPVKLVWSQEFSGRDEARAAEAQLKGWGRAKKLALIRGDWEAISVLSKGKEGASTSSAKPVFVAERFLHPHLEALPSEPFNLEATVRHIEARWDFRFRLTGPIDLVLVPPLSAPERRDDLWQRTCFEAFVATEGSGYIEFNFSPSGAWARYRFDAYREGMRESCSSPPEVRCKLDRYTLELSARITVSELIGAEALNLAAVLEEKSGRKSYWALAHPPSGPPDFHHPDCFVLDLPPAPRA